MSAAGESPASSPVAVSSSEGEPEKDDDELIRNTSPMASNDCHGWAFTYVILSSVVAAIGGILFGYDTGIISGALLQLADEFHLSCGMQEMLVSAMLVGAVVTSMFGGCLVDLIGRKVTIIITAVVFLLGALMLAFAKTYMILIVGRVVVGFSVAVSATAECTYISEIAPAHRRGALVSLNELGITVGFLLAYCMNLAFINVEEGWRYMFGLAAIPATLQALALFCLPYSPRFLMIQGHEEQAMLTLEQLRGTPLVEAELQSIKVSLEEQQGVSFCDLFMPADNMLKRLMIATGLVFFQQFSGQSNVMYYAPTVFLSLGFQSNTAAVLGSVGLGVVKVLFTVLTVCLIDRGGRRKFLLVGTALMTVSLTVLAIFTSAVSSEHMVEVCVDSNSSSLLSLNQTNSVANATLGEEKYPGVGVFALLALMGYISGYSIGFGPVSWLIISEIFPSRLKGRAGAIAAFVNWTSSLILASTFLEMMSDLGVPTTFIFYAMLCLAGLVFVFCFIPETKGRTLEQIVATLQSESYRWPGQPCCCRTMPSDYDDLDATATATSPSLQAKHDPSREGLHLLPPNNQS